MSDATPTPAPDASQGGDQKVQVSAPTTASLAQTKGDQAAVAAALGITAPTS